MTKNEIRKFLNVPDNYRILLQQGGATMQYTACVKNLIGLKPKKIANLMVTGMWSNQNYAEMKKHCNVNVVMNNWTDNECTKCVPQEQWNINPDASFFYFCTNETVHGFRFDLETFPWHLIPKDMPVVGDFSSNLGTEHVPWDKFGVVFAGAQKNLGPAGCTVIIIREDLLGHAEKDVPILCDWALHEKSPDTYYNTPAIFPMYVTGMNVSYMNQMGGVDYYMRLSLQKSQMLWECIDSSNGYYKSKIVDKAFRSRTNVIFRIAGGDKALEAKFESEAKKVGIVQIKAHVVNPAIRISMYNAMPLEGVMHLTQFMRSF
jgi:phosphoserine aminotransferase